MSITRSDGSLNEVVGVAAASVGAATPDPEVAPNRAQRRRFSAAYKAAVIRQAENCTRHGELGALLRREGLYASTLASFRRQLAAGRLKEVEEDQKRQQRRAQATQRQRESRALARLQRENEQLRAIIEVQKKLSEILSIPLPTEEFNGERG